MQNELLTAVADSVATGLPIDVAISYVNVDAAIALLRSRFVDVDWDTFPTYVTIFGDDHRIEGDAVAGSEALHLGADAGDDDHHHRTDGVQTNGPSAL